MSLHDMGNIWLAPISFYVAVLRNLARISLLICALGHRLYMSATSFGPRCCNSADRDRIMMQFFREQSYYV